jgi:ABC-type Fe3+ transport system permease subunit
VLYAVLFFLAFVLVAPAIDPSAGDETANAVLSVMAQPAFWGPMAFVMLLVQMAFGAFAHALGGPAAWMVRQEAYQGGTAITETFG